jgi:chromosome segregation ATPase
VSATNRALEALERQRAAAEVRAQAAERQLAATVDELTDARTAADELAAEVVRLTVELAQTRQERDDAGRRLAATVDELTDAQAALETERAAHQRSKVLRDLAIRRARNRPDPFGPVMR